MINRLHIAVGINIASAAPIVFQIIDAPRSIGFGVLLLVAIAAFVTRAGVGAGRGVDIIIPVGFPAREWW